MTESVQDLSAQGNYFANDEYLTQDLAEGQLRNRAGAPMLALTDEFIVSLLNAMEASLGAQAPAAVSAFGRDWGRRAAEQFSREMAGHRHKPLAELPLGLFAADLAAAFQEYGWGRIHFDFSHYATGLICVEVADSFLGAVVKPEGRPVERLLADFLAGIFSHVAGTELACLQTECRALGAPCSRFVISVPERVEAVTGWTELGKSHADILAKLESIQTTV